MKFPYFLRPDQLAALSKLRNDDHLIYISATGSGKSTVFQKYLFDHPGTRALFISPLNALSRQQSERFESLGISTFYREAPREESGVWIMSPETIQGRMWDEIRNWKPQFLIVDEAHCVWEWGKEFRPHYRKILDLIELPSLQKSIWCSATFPPAFRAELKSRFLRIKNCKIEEVGTFQFSSKIHLTVEKIPPEKKLIWIGNRLALHRGESGVIFCNTRASAEKLQRCLVLWGVRSFYYHAGLSPEEKLAREQQLKLDAASQTPVVIIATSAFGMGMDYAFFKFCILFEPSYTLLALVQAVGRIGRGAESARAYVLWNEGDAQTEVYHWCKTSDHRIKYLESYFNGESHERTHHHSYGAPSIDRSRTIR